MNWKKWFSARFILMIFNTAIVCILFMVLYVRKDSTILTHTFSAIPIKFINFQEIDEFLKSFSTPSNARIKLKYVDIIGYEQRYTFEITYYHKDDEGLSEEVKKEFLNYFRQRILTIDNFKNQKFSKVKIDLKNKKISFAEWNGEKIQIPSSIEFTSYSFSLDNLRIANASTSDESALIDLGANVSISIAGKKLPDSLESDLSLLSLKLGDQFLFFEILSIR